MNPDIQTIALIRHARSKANDDPAVYLTTPDHAISLSRPEDDPAAHAAGDLLGALGHEPSEMCSWRSPYVRCVQTEALVMRRALGAFDVVKRHYAVVMRVGGALLVVVGLLLVSGLWEDLMIEVRTWVSGFATVV